LHKNKQKKHKQRTTILKVRLKLTINLKMGLLFWLKKPAQVSNFHRNRDMVFRKTGNYPLTYPVPQSFFSPI